MTTGVDVYLDVPYARASGHPVRLGSAINNTTGGFRRDFVFNVGTDALGFVIAGGNNSTRCGANPADPVTRRYTSRHPAGTRSRHFSGVPGGPLMVTLQLIKQDRPMSSLARGPAAIRPTSST